MAREKWREATKREDGLDERCERCGTVCGSYYHTHSHRTRKKPWGIRVFLCVIVQIIRWLRLRWRGPRNDLSSPPTWHNSAHWGWDRKETLPHIFRVHSSALSVRNREQPTQNLTAKTEKVQKMAIHYLVFKEKKVLNVRKLFIIVIK